MRDPQETTLTPIVERLKEERKNFWGIDERDGSMSKLLSDTIQELESLRAERDTLRQHLADAKMEIENVHASRIAQQERRAAAVAALTRLRGQIRPRVHGNGFLQLDLSPTRRLHVFGAEGIPKQTTETPLHDHTFDFTSRVLVGELENRVYDIITDSEGPFYIHQARVRDREDTILENTGIRVCLELESSHRYKAGQTYRMERGLFHETVVAVPTITVIEKDGPSLAQGGPSPRVLVPVGATPDNEFNRYSLDPSVAWGIIVRELLAALLGASEEPT